MHLDIETYSSAALPKCGVYRYCDAPDFEILLLSYAFDDAPVVTVDMACGETLPDAFLHALEDAHGRDRSGPRYGDRTLDIDLVFYDDLVLEGPGHLRLPRDELRHAFVLKPLAEIAPDFVDPGSGRPLQALGDAHPDHGIDFAVVGI